MTDDFGSPAFRAWVLKHNIGPGMNDRWRGGWSNPPRSPPPDYVQPKNYTGFDGSVGDGWIDILDRLATDLIAMGWDRDLHQVKEKFGTLRFYIGEGSEEMWDRIRQAEEESAVTCETCGQPGEVVGRGWYYAACPDHIHFRDRDENWGPCPACTGIEPERKDKWGRCEACRGHGEVWVGPAGAERL